MTQDVSRTIAVAEIFRAVTKALALEEQSLPLRNIITKERPHTGRKLCQKAKVAQEDTGSQGQKSKGQTLRMAIYPSHRVWFDDLPPESVDGYSDLKEAFLENFRQFKVKSRDVKGAPEIMRISGFMHGITNPELVKSLHDKIPKLVDEMMRITTSFLRGGRWQLVTKNERSYFLHGNSRRLDISKISKKKVLKISKGQSGDRIEEGRNKLCDLLQQNLDVFTWKPADMTDVLMHVAEHQLNIREGCPPVRQKRRSQAADRNQTIQEEVEKLVDTDYKDLNKACLKDGYPLPQIDLKVESLCGSLFKCFVNAYKGYHQIKMAKEDEEKTTFITSQGVFCYSKMPFGLRNAGATNQRLVDKAFYKQIDRILKGRRRDVPRLQGQ
nr:reverse transcriptase domain-containing protein [Tanacetum cinerariifolium]